MWVKYLPNSPRPSNSASGIPSGHTATAFGLAVGLGRIYPQGRWLFFSFAMLAALQRVDVDAHYLSDTVAAAAIGFLCAACVFDARGLGRWFDRLERRAPP